MNDIKEPNELKQPINCIYDDEIYCCYPIDDCENCPANPKNHDLYWGISAASIG